jgi:hypothetical protein
MDMATSMHEHTVFHLTGRRSGAGLEPIDGLGLRPALFARFHDLTRLRYDFPLVLAEAEDADAFVYTLSGVIDALLQQVAPRGIDGERLRKNVLRLEREIRVLLAEGAAGSLGALWRQAAERLVALGGEPVESDLARARAALAVDGELADCDRELAARLTAHAWNAVQREKTGKARRNIDKLVIQLSDLIRGDHLRSAAGRDAETLKAGIGGAHQQLFDFDAMARLLAKPSGKSALSEARRRRIEAALDTLRADRFFAAEGAHACRFDDAGAAMAAFRERLPQMAELMKAMAIAELEVEGRYAEAQHDAYFAGFDASSLGAQDLALFPDYLVRQASHAGITEALASGVPLKILVECDDVADARIAGTAMALGEAFVLQAASSNLYRVRGQLVAALRYPGSALVSIYNGALEGLPGYLAAAAAAESRAFPAFAYDPAAGADWAQRFSLVENPQPAETWPLHEFAYADEASQRVSERLAFTYLDFAAGDARNAGHFARVPRADWGGVPEAVPWIYAVDGESRLHKLIVDEKLAHAAQRCAEAWRRLQELDGLKGGRVNEDKGGEARQKLGEEVREEKKEKPAPAAAPAVPAAAEDRPSDEPYIETPRCSSCNECTNINNAMFAYNENQQAYIADPLAGSYAQLVEAAESCQLSIIHPGKPRDPNEPGLEELLKRAEPFL